MRIHILRFLSLTSAVLLFSSCLSLASDFRIRPDGGGSLSLDYRVSKLAASVRKDSLAGGRLIPLPLDEEEAREKAASFEGLRIDRFSRREDLDYIYIDSELSFDSLPPLSAYAGVPLEHQDAGDAVRLTIRFFERNAPLPPETAELLDTLFEEDLLEFSLRTPERIRSSSFGRINSSRQQVDYTVKLGDAYRKDSFVWTLEWQ